MRTLLLVAMIVNIGAIAIHAVVIALGPHQPMLTAFGLLLNLMAVSCLYIAWRAKRKPTPA